MVYLTLLSDFRLDRLIQKIKISHHNQPEPLVDFIKKLAIEERITLEDARLIIKKYKAEKDGN